MSGPARVGVLIPLPLDGAYDYLVPEDMALAPGDFVRVPLGPRSVTGVVWGAGTGDVAAGKLKPVSERLPAPPLPEPVRKFIDWVAGYTMAPPGAVLRMAMSVSEALAPRAPKLGYRLAGKDPESEGVQLTPARARVLEALHGSPPETQAEIARRAGVSTSVVKGLIEAGLLAPAELDIVPGLTPPRPDLPGPGLSKGQQAAADDLAARVRAHEFSVALLDGVTGSGKTEVYFEAIAEALRQDKQVLVLLPEIALGPQWLERFAARFGARPAEWHSDLGQTQRRETWRAVAEGRARVVVGARSALFLPFGELGLIVVDEEHESAFKQMEGVTYNARDMAVVRGQIGQCPVVLASATPSLETLANVERGRYERLELPARHGGAALPDIELVDMRAEKLPATKWLSAPLREWLALTLEAGEQALLFLNRRGYAPLTLCRACGHRLQCPQCTAWLVDHRALGRLQCHHCGHSLPRPRQCPSCEAEDSLVACGPGIERLAEEFRGYFPKARMALMASDAIASPRQAAELVAAIHAHEIDVIIGTQLVAKGHHFPKLTLVGVVDGDLGLSGGDLRAAERTYQLLSQVSGRAGREDRPGRCLVQTYMPEHPVMQGLASGDRERFIEIELADRQAAQMPPFGRLAALVLSGYEPKELDESCRALARIAPHRKDFRVLGPAPAPLAMIRGRHRRRFLVKAGRDVAVQPLLRDWLSRVKLPGGVRLSVDIDPYSFM